MSAVGLAVPARISEDHFVTALVGALAGRLIEEGTSLMTRVVRDDEAEERLYRHWASIGGISGVALLGVRTDDPRLPVLAELGLPVAAVADASHGDGFPAVVVDVEGSVAALRTFLAGRAQRRTVYVVAEDDRDDAPWHAVVEDAAVLEDGEVDDSFEVVHAGRGGEAVVTAATAALAAGPATLVFHSDVHAAAALAAFRERGLRVPEDVAIVSWTYSTLCQSTTPSITALNRRGVEIGAMLGDRMLGALAGDRTTQDRAPAPFVVLGETT